MQALPFRLDLLTRLILLRGGLYVIIFVYHKEL